ncbi:unnamed protein product [Absidia cylindrospora]
MTTMEAIPQIQSMSHQPKDMTALFNQLQVNVNQSQPRISDGTTSTLSVSSSSTTPSTTSTKPELEHAVSVPPTTNNNSALSTQHPPFTTCHATTGWCQWTLNIVAYATHQTPQ